MQGLFSFIILHLSSLAKALKEKISYNVKFKIQIYQVQSQLVVVAKDHKSSLLKTTKFIVEELVLDTLGEKCHLQVIVKCKLHLFHLEVLF